MSAPAVCVNGEFVSRCEVVQYVANKLGGVHMDTRRSGPDARLQATLNVRILGKPAVYFELLSIGQTVVGSPDAVRFAAEVEKRAAG